MAKDRIEISVPGDAVNRYYAGVSELLGDDSGKIEPLVDLLCDCFDLPRKEATCCYAERKLDSFGLSVRAINSLVAVGLSTESTVAELAELAKRKAIIECRGIGRKTLSEIEPILDAGGFEYRSNY